MRICYGWVLPLVTLFQSVATISYQSNQLTTRRDVLFMFRMATRARSSLKRNAERKFPIRIRVTVPECGHGKKLDAIHDWLRRELGAGQYAWASDSQPQRDASAIYLPTIEIALRLVNKFDLELLFFEDMKLY